MTITIPEAPSPQPVFDALNELDERWLLRDRAQQDTIEQLRAQLPPTPPASSTLFGCSRPDATTHAAVDVVRTYLTAGQHPSSWQADGGLTRAHAASNRAIIVSWKDAPGDWLRSLLATSPTDRTIYGCQNHEPLDNFTTPAAVAEYQRRWLAALEIMADFDHVKATPILDGHDVSSWPRFAVDGADVTGVDRYNTGIQKPARYVPPAELFDNWLAFVGSGATLIGETGSGPAGGDVAGLINWSRELHDVLADAGNVEAAAWWYQGTLQQPAAFDAFLAGSTR